MNAKRMGIFRRTGVLLAMAGPGLFLIGYNIGTGSITTMASAGSRYGMSLFWALVLSCLFTYVMLEAYGRYTTVTGETALNAFRKHFRFGKSLAICTMIGLVIGELTALAGVTAIVAEMVQEWTRYAFGGEGANRTVVTLVIMIGSFILLWYGKYSRFEKFLILLVIIMGASFLLSMFMVVPEPMELVKGFVPAIPNEPDAFLIVAGMAGTTCSAMVFIMRSIVVAEKGWTGKDLKLGKVDALISSGMMLLLSASVMACAAGTLFRIGQPVERAVDMVKTLEPLAGKFAISLFVIGIIGAGISTLFPIVLVAPWLLCDYRGVPRDIKSPMFRTLAGLSLLICLTIPIFGGNPVWIMVGSQALQSLLLPLITIPIMLLLNRKDLMGGEKAGFGMNLGLWATLIFGVVTGYAGILGLLDPLEKLFR